MDSQQAGNALWMWILAAPVVAGLVDLFRTGRGSSSAMTR